MYNVDAFIYSSAAMKGCSNISLSYALFKHFRKVVCVEQVQVARELTVPHDSFKIGSQAIHKSQPQKKTASRNDQGKAMIRGRCGFPHSTHKCNRAAPGGVSAGQLVLLATVPGGSDRCCVLKLRNFSGDIRWYKRIRV